MGRIIAVGGGDVRKHTTAINREIIALTGRKHPNVLYVPTASRDNPDSVATFRKAFERLGCRVDVLLCIRETPSKSEIRRKIRRADAIYVGGGNTLMMMRRWHFLGVDTELAEAYCRGTVLSGGSAGAICWFENGHSDSMKGYGHIPWVFIRVSGLGFVKGTLCPHYHHKDRRIEFLRMIHNLGGLGIALDDRCALEIVGDKWRIVASGRGAKAYSVTRRLGRVHEREIPRTHGFQPLARLYSFIADTPAHAAPVKMRNWKPRLHRT